MKKDIELDTKILNKNLEITKLHLKERKQLNTIIDLTKQVDNLTSDNVDLKEQLKTKDDLLTMSELSKKDLKENDHNLLSLLTEVNERMYPMMEYCERLQPVKVNSESSDKYKGTIDLTDEDEMMMTKLFRLVDKEEMTNYDDQTTRSILKDLRKVIKSLES
tara:strand:+ start:1287 stop:1772 length:486 start_codon:yes stop_codon:yes gene_type:complete